MPFFADSGEAAVQGLGDRPPDRVGSPEPRLREGAVCLNDPVRAEVCLAVFEVTRTAMEPGLTGSSPPAPGAR